MTRLRGRLSSSTDQGAQKARRFAYGAFDLRATRAVSATAIAVAMTLSACGTSRQLERDVADMKKELAAQRTQQAALAVRIERLELRQSRMTAAPALRLESLPTQVDPLDGLPIVRLEPPSEQSLSGQDRAINAPPLDTRVSLREPSDEELARIEAARPASLDAHLARTNPAVEAVFAEGIRLYNTGARLEAAALLTELARAHPRHDVADNALYLSGLAHAINGNCRRAEPLLENVVTNYPTGDAAAPAMLSLAECAHAGGRIDEARDWFAKVVRTHPRTPESTQARSALAALGADP